MARRDKWRVFEDKGKYLDRFGLVVALAAVSVSTLALIDLDDARNGLRSDIGWYIVMGSVGATLIAAVRASGVRKRWRVLAWIAIGAVFVASGIFALLEEIPGGLSHFDAARPSVWWVLIAAVSPVLVLHRILRHKSITRDTLYGAVAVYLLLAISFSYLFLYLDVQTADYFFGQFESTSSYMYFSLVTITTVGYGDLTPVGDVARYLASAEAVIGQVLLVTVVARTVSLYAYASQESDAQDVSAGRET